MAPLHTTSTLHPYPLPSVPPLPTLPILLPPIALLAIILVLYIRRPATIVPTRPMAQIKTPLLARGRVRTHRRVSNYGGIRVPSSPSDEDEPEDGTGKGDGRPAHPRGDKRPKFMRREEEERNPLSDSVPTLSGGENDSSDDQGPSTPSEEVEAPIRFDRVVKGKGPVVMETEVVETPAEERNVGMQVGMVCV